MPFSYVVSRILDAYPDLDPKDVQGRIALGSTASLRDRFIYVEVPKNACTTMKMVLREQNESAPLKLFTEFGDSTHRNDYVHARVNVPFPPLSAFGDKDQRELLEAGDVLRFTIVRNPYARLVSAWRDKVFLCVPGVEDVYTAVRGEAPPIAQKNPVNFSEFVSYIESQAGRAWDVHWRRQVDLTFPKALSYTHIGKFETLEATIGVFREKMKRSNAFDTPRVNESLLKRAPNYYDALAARVYMLYEEDFSTFEYDADSWPRRQEVTSTFASEERLIDEFIERNLIIGHLWQEQNRMIQERDRIRQKAYRFSLERVRNKLRRIIRSSVST